MAFTIKDKNKIQLFTAPFYNPMKATVVLFELEADFEYHFVNLLKGEQQSPEFLAINPNHRVPAIIDKEKTIFESGAITHYLAKKYNKLLDNEEIVLQWQFFVESGFIPEMRPVYFAFNILQENKVENYKRNISELKRMLKIVEEQFHKTEHLSGNNFSIADIHLFCAIYAIYTSKFEFAKLVELESFSKTYAKFQEFLNRKAVQQTLTLFTQNS